MKNQLLQQNPFLKVLVKKLLSKITNLVNGGPGSGRHPEGGLEDDPKAVADYQTAALSDDKYGWSGPETLEEKMILSFTNRGYQVNYALRDGELTNGDRAYIRNLERTLDRQPDFEGEVYRGVEGVDAKDYASNVGGTVEWDAYTSSSKDPARAERFSKGGVVFVIQSKTGKDISSKSGMKHEQEVLFGRNIEFQIEKVEGNRVHLKEK